MSKRASIKSIAEKLGISTATVSLVLSGKAENGRVSKEIAEKIKETAIAVNYQPNGLARSLRIGCSYTIGLVVADISNPFFGQLAFHIQKEAEKYGYTAIIVNTNEDDVKMGKIMDILRSRQVDGYIIIPTENGDRYIRPLVEQKTPVVLVDRYFPHISTSNVIVDNYKSSLEATQLLIRQGCKRIASFVYLSNLQHMVERKKGYCDAMQKADMYDPQLLFEIQYDRIEADIVECMDNIFNEQETVDGMFFTTNSISILGIRELVKRDILIQEQIKVVCFDKSDAFDFMKHPFPYIKQPVARMGERAVELLIGQISGKSPDRENIQCQLATKLIVK
ncbi:MAG: LacI family DNA-binding transcriptional regulator [Tannerellaceae bacterium]|nr:LacI family DNA-binding transcriptional regulator [Tannerellaceae bacterium]MCC8197427.1 LacI family DNA-binding transcriptional regulator [Tannerellaceae bacterium]